MYMLCHLIGLTDCMQVYLPSMNMATGMDACVFHPSKDTVYMHVAKEAVKNLQLKFYFILMFFPSSLT